MIYLDNAAATPVSKKVIEAMMPYYSELFHNPSAHYSAARNVKVALEDAREDIARQIGARPSEIIFTAGGTESANLAIKGIMDTYPEANCVVSAIEHDAVAKSAQHYECKIAPVDNVGCVDKTA